jgi:hypothetical protein
LTQLGRRFGLSTELGSGVWCGENGVFVGSVPLLEQSNSQSGLDHWQPRPVSELNRDLSECYDLPIEFIPKIGGLTAASRALNRGDLLHAQIATMHLQIPDPPSLTKSSQNAEEIIDLVRQLLASGLLKADWDPAKHPRWPAGSPSGIGGELLRPAPHPKMPRQERQDRRSYLLKLQFRSPLNCQEFNYLPRSYLH